MLNSIINKIRKVKSRYVSGKKLILFLMLAMFSMLASAQQAVSPQPVRFKIHKEKCMIRHEQNGVRHDFRKFHRYKHFKHKMRKHRQHRKLNRPVR